MHRLYDADSDNDCGWSVSKPNGDAKVFPNKLNGKLNAPLTGKSFLDRRLDNDDESEEGSVVRLSSAGKNADSSVVVKGCKRSAGDGDSRPVKAPKRRAVDKGKVLSKVKAMENSNLSGQFSIFVKS